MSSGISETEADSSLSCTAKSPRQPKHPLQEVHYENISYLDPAQHELSIKVINLV